MKEYSGMLDQAIQFAIKSLNITDVKANLENTTFINLVLDKLAVNFGKEILGLVPGYVSTEIDARLSFDTQGSIARARGIIKLYEEEGISKDRILVKLVGTWEGIEAAKVLEKEGIKTNVTLVFSLPQAVKCGEDGIYLISPFVGRINDFYSKKLNKTYTPEEEPGVHAVKDIYNYLKHYDYKTVVMAASLRSAESCLEISGVDRITMPPACYESLGNLSKPAETRLSSELAKKMNIEKISVEEKSFRWLLNDSDVGTDKLSDGIRLFSNDARKLEKIVRDRISSTC